MKRYMKRMIAAITGALMLVSAFGSVSADAAKANHYDGIIKTEFWMTSYYIDGEDGLHPDIQCQALYYSTGKVEVYFWNVRQFDESFDEEKIIKLTEWIPVPTSHMAYKFKTDPDNVVYLDEHAYLTSGSLDDIDVNYYPAEYAYIYERKPEYASEYGFKLDGCGFSESPKFRKQFGFTVDLYYQEYGFNLQGLSCSTSLHKFGTSLGVMRFSPKSADFTGEYSYNFRVMGHNLTVNNDLMNGYNHEPELRAQIAELQKALDSEKADRAAEKKDYERKIADLKYTVECAKEQSINYELEQKYHELQKDYENLHSDYEKYYNKSKSLEEEIESLKSGKTISDPTCDINGDGYFTISDVVWLCRYLAEDITVIEK